MDPKGQWQHKIGSIKKRNNLASWSQHGDLHFRGLHRQTLAGYELWLFLEKALPRGALLGRLMRTLYLADTQITDVLAADNVAASPLFNIWAFSDSVAFDSKQYEECVAETVKGSRK